MTRDGLLTRLALLSIRAYQRYLSPVKGFSCPYRVIAGGDSCSAYGYRVIQRRGVGTGLKLLRRRRVAAAKRRQAEEDAYLRKTRGESGPPTTGTTTTSDDR